MTAAHALSAVEMLARFRAKTLSPAEVWQDLEAHIARCEPSLHALFLYDPEDARAQAKAATERWAKGQPRGALDGVPATVKDNIATTGAPMPLGTAATTLTP
jgi:Asp-tRNA(Asn)/Glu-tRNA(Gln) amidotransferase A subunit family amidase